MSPDPVNISVITPTIGRPSLRRLAADLLPQFKPGDEWIVVADGKQDAAQDIYEEIRRDFISYREYGPDPTWGHAQANHALMYAKGSHVWRLDDDDRAHPNALNVIRCRAEKNPRRPLIFRTIYNGYPIWRDNDKHLYCGNVSTQCYVVPNVAGLLGSWGRAYEGDYEFIRSTVALYPHKENDIVWCAEVLSVIGMARAPEEYKRKVENWKW